MKNDSKTRMYLLICCICLISAGCETRPGIVLSNKLQSGEHTKLWIPGMQMSDYFFKTSDNAQMLYLLNDTLLLTALDSNDIVITAKEKHGSDEIRFKIKASGNPLLNAAHKRLNNTGFSMHDFILNSNVELFKMLNRPCTDFNLTDADGNDITQRCFTGKTTMIDCWEYGCRVCMEEMEDLNKLESAAGPGIQLLGFYNEEIRRDKNGAYLFISPEMKISEKGKMKPDTSGFKTQFNFRHISNAGDLMKKWNVYIYPTKLFIDQNGVVRYIYCGGGGKMDLYKSKLEEIAAMY